MNSIPSAIAAATQQATGQPYRSGNRLQLLQNGDEIFPTMLDAICNAQSSIEFSTYVYWKSRIASQFADALIERAGAGVAVRLLVDAIGGAVMVSRTLWRLERAGVKVSWFRPMRWPYLHKFNNRTHRKILVIDNAIGFTGGVGIAAEWTGQAQDRGHWRETHCRLEGPSCADLSAGFSQNWREAARELVPAMDAPSTLPRGVAIQTTISTANQRRTTSIDQLFAAAFIAARHKLWITTAYFVPSAQVCELLVAAAARGVDVKVLTNGPLTNHKFTRWAGRASYETLLNGGVEIYEYRPTVLHTKTITADGTWSCLGSANLDGRSLIYNDELNISVDDTKIAMQLENAFLTDLDHARQITLDSWHVRSWHDRLAEQSTFLVRGQL